MRPIEFRGKRFDNGEWVYGYLGEKYTRAGDEWELLGFAIQPPQSPNTAYLVEPDTVGQYIGLKDKNGKKIFEGDILIGDILELSALQSLIGVVEYLEESAFIIRITNRKSWLFQKVRFCHFANYKVIGNIFDTHELLEKMEE